MRIHVRPESLGYFLPLVNQQIPLALRNVPLGFRLSLLDHRHENYDEGLKVHSEARRTATVPCSTGGDKALMSMFAIGGVIMSMRRLLGSAINLSA